MSKLLDLLDREYSLSGSEEIDATDGFAVVWRMANNRRSLDIAEAIGASSESEKQQHARQQLTAQVGKA